MVQTVDGASVHTPGKGSRSRNFCRSQVFFFRFFLCIGTVHGQASLTDLGGQLPESLKEAWGSIFGSAMQTQLVQCQQDAMPCDIQSLSQNIVDATTNLLDAFNSCPSGCAVPEGLCTGWRRAVIDQPLAYRDLCAAQNKWPGTCITLFRALKEQLANVSWEPPVMCSIISPGPSFNLTPSCKTLVDMTVDNAPTLTNGGCKFASRDACVSNLCSVYKQFAWRIKPRNLQESFVKNRYPSDFFLNGCQDMQKYAFDDEEKCQARKDVIGFCDCFCKSGLMPNIPEMGFYKCRQSVDAYLLFGRFGITNVGLSSDCEPELCRVFGSLHTAPECRDLHLPSATECKAFQIPKVSTKADVCPFRSATNQTGVMQCLDGSVCNVNSDGWECCVAHRGRAKCPKELPVMCDILCSGITEYCCKQENQCSPRKCPIPIQNVLYFWEPETMTNTTTLAGSTLIQEDTALRLMRGWWVWLFALIPCCCGALALYYYRRRIKNKVTVDPLEKLPDTIATRGDDMGKFNVIRPDVLAEFGKPKPRVCITMPELPFIRPLGLELLELRVIRVHAWGAECGFQVGDVIVEIAGHEVHSFEELWQRIQVERDRPPVRFTVERRNILTTAEEEAAADAGPRGPKLNATSKQLPATTSKIAAAPEPLSLRQTAATEAVALPSAVAGWDFNSYMQHSEDEDDDTDEDCYSELTTELSSKKTQAKTDNYVSRIDQAFEVIKKPKPTDGKATELENELQQRNFHVGKPFKTNPVVFKTDAWGRSVASLNDRNSIKPIVSPP